MLHHPPIGAPDGRILDSLGNIEAIEGHDEGRLQQVCVRGEQSACRAVVDMQHVRLEPFDFAADQAAKGAFIKKSTQIVSDILAGRFGDGSVLSRRRT